MSAGVAAIVINYNARERVLATLASLLGQGTALASVTVVDNGSTDGSAEAIAERFPMVQVMALGENRGLPAARNAGLAAATAERVVLVDADLLFEAGTIGRMLAAMDETGAAVVCPRVRLHPEREVVQADGAEAHFVGTMTLRHGHTPLIELDGDASERRTVGGCIGACMLLDRRAVVEAGGFEELMFFYFEDLEFMLRMRGRGHRFACEPAAEVFHDRGGGTAGLSFRGQGKQRYPSRRVYFSTRHRWLCMLIHYRLRTLVLLSPALLVYELASLVLVVARGWLWPWLRAAWWVVTHAGTVWRKRRAAQRRRVVPDRELLSGGPLPLAPGVIGNRWVAGAIGGLSGGLNAYWRLIRPMV